MSVIIETSIGDVVVDLYTDERPRCCLNFLKLCKIKYYNFSLFHNVQHDLVAQAGDPTATGRGGQSVFGHLYGEQARFFDMEVIPRILHSKKGLISMVNNGSGMHGSQFFFTLADRLDYLDGKHTVFGEVAEGMDIIDKLNNAFCDDDFRPHQDIRIYHTVILDDPYDDPKDLVVPSASPPPTQEMLDSDRIPCDADINEDDGKTEQELAEMQAEREAKANTQLLEMVGDLPDADVAPPENVLFVCKLNPVTTSDDLEIIFSRFGNIVSCEVIKDQKTGESLQYAFVEFENEENCNNAYFKMDNVLIDDRRIHVDFSQSVSKIKWKGKGRGVELQKDGDAPDYILKNYERKSHGYDLVYAEDDLAAMASIKEKKPKKSGHDDKDRGERRDKSDKRHDTHERRRGHHDRREERRDHFRFERHHGGRNKTKDNRQDDSQSDSDYDNRQRQSQVKNNSDNRGRRQYNRSNYSDDENHRKHERYGNKNSGRNYDSHRKQIKDKKSSRYRQSSDDSNSDEERYNQRGSGKKDREYNDRRYMKDESHSDMRKRYHESSDELDSGEERHSKSKKEKKKKRHNEKADDYKQENRSYKKKKKKKAEEDYYSSDEDRRRQRQRERH